MKNFVYKYFLCFLTITSCETNELEDEVTIPDTLTSYFWVIEIKSPTQEGGL